MKLKLFTLITIIISMILTTVCFASSDNAPDILMQLDKYYSEHEDTEAYHIKKNVEEGRGLNEYQMSLVYDEVPESNGTAFVLGKEDSDSFEIRFQYSTFLGQKLCAPQLIKAVTISTIYALCEIQGIEDKDVIEDLISEVVASYDDEKYTSTTNVGNYAVAFEPENIYATVLNVVNLEEYEENVSIDGYAKGSYKDMSAKLNSGTEYCFEGKVIEYESGQYTNFFSTYKCMIAKVELDDGNIMVVAHYPENVPVEVEVGSTYTFYGTTMFDINGDLLFYLHHMIKK